MRLSMSVIKTFSFACFFGSEAFSFASLSWSVNSSFACLCFFVNFKACLSILIRCNSYF